MDQTIQEKVQQAVTEAYEMLAQLNVAEADLSAAKMAEDAARLASPVDGLKGEAAREMANAKGRAEEQHTQQRRVTASYFERATRDRDQAVKAAGEQFDQAVIDAVDSYNLAVNQALHAQEEAMSVPVATVHKARQEVTALRNTIREHNRNTQKRLGINLDNLVSG